MEGRGITAVGEGNACGRPLVCRRRSFVNNRSGRLVLAVSVELVLCYVTIAKKQLTTVFCILLHVGVFINISFTSNGSCFFYINYNI
jgi:hypothetical protein